MFCTMAIKPGSYTPKGVQWIAECTIDGQRYEAASRYGASCALARALVAAGVEDQPFDVLSPEGRLLRRWPSLHAAAESTFSEGKVPLHRAKFVPYDG